VANYGAAEPTPTFDESTVVVRGVSKRFGRSSVINNVHLRVGAREIVALLGPNGAGKSTLMDIVLGLVAPDEGQVSICGHPPKTAAALGAVSAVTQSDGLLNDLTVAQTVRLAAALYRRNSGVDAALRSAGLGNIAEKAIRTCSGGQRQRVRFAVALVSESELLVLDEPTTAMDTHSRGQFWQTIKAEVTKGRSVLFATHHLEEAEAHADRIVLMQNGAVIADAPASEIAGRATGNTVRAVVPDALDLPDLASFGEVTIDGQQLSVRTQRSDELARYLLTSTRSRDLEITRSSLADALQALVEDPSYQSSSLTSGGRRPTNGTR
jgi:ABC-2 type transport system ATP-binding protein